MSVFTDPLIRATNLSRLELSTTYLIGTLTSSLLLPFGGSLLDRYGARVAALGSSFLLGVTLVGFTQVAAGARLATSLLQGMSPAWAAAALLTVGFTLLRFSGQGMLTMASRTMLTKWFDRRRGLATGTSGVFVAFGFASAPWGLQELIASADWRTAYWFLAVAVGVGMSLFAWAFYRDNPEECGLRMDGKPVHEPLVPSEMPPEVVADEAATEARSLTRPEALRTRAFWSVTAALAIQAMVFTGITFHIVDLGREAGLSSEQSVSFFLPLAAVSTVVGLLSGWAADRVEARVLVVAFLLAQAVGFMGAGRLSDPLFAGLMIAGGGAANGLFSTIAAVAIPNLFGRMHLGAIASAQMSCMVAGSALGPVSLAYAKNALGSYREGLLLCTGLALAAMLFAAMTPTPRAAAKS
ncbi:MAG: MFS transporter [Bryobacterales bacterium]